MFKSKSRNYNQGKHNSRSYTARPNFRRGTKHEKKLDPQLFIKKSVGTSLPAEEKTDVLFADYQIIDKLKRNIAEHGYTNPTAIQEKAIPEILNGRDIIGI